MAIPWRKGRGSAQNPENRFDGRALTPLPHWDWDVAADELAVRKGRKTRFHRDTSKSILSRNDSPDIGFERSINPYRGCEHGCVYCYARPTHEYFGLSAGLDFESEIFVKEDAARLLRAAFNRDSWVPQLVALSGVTDPYQPAERLLGLTRSCLEVMLEFRNPVQIITKNRAVVRDCDLFRELAGFGCVAIAVSVTTLDPELQRTMEPRASTPALRLDAIERLARAGVPVGVMIGPVLPGLTEHEIPAILRAAADAGAGFAGYTLLRLPHGVKDLFLDWLEQHRPERRAKVISRLRNLRSGALSDPRFGSRQRGEGPFAEQIAGLFSMGLRRTGLDGRGPRLSVDHFRRPGDLFSWGAIAPTLADRDD